MQSSVSGTIRRASQITGGTTRTGALGLTMSALDAQTPGGSMTFTATCGNGARTATTRALNRLRETEQPGRRAVNRTACFAVGVSSTVPRVAGPRTEPESSPPKQFYVSDCASPLAPRKTDLVGTNVVMHELRLPFSPPHTAKSNDLRQQTAHHCDSLKLVYTPHSQRLATTTTESLEPIRDAEVGGSNPLAPTTIKHRLPFEAADLIHPPPPGEFEPPTE